MNNSGDREERRIRVERYGGFFIILYRKIQRIHRRFRTSVSVSTESIEKKN